MEAKYNRIEEKEQMGAGCNYKTEKGYDIQHFNSSIKKIKLIRNFAQ